MATDQTEMCVLGQIWRSKKNQILRPEPRYCVPSKAKGGDVGKTWPEGHPLLGAEVHSR